ncbi:lachesin-like isoform X2 [Gigantopelta aegis]|uniref:lachesin-like isoform X2 n=1 Tax=Gigantopelta aegis TaxID=1735272 RepID=UPI001B88D9F8|nr:lachesin-like isoform X2 [Gigantopelta aegis]
MTSIWDVFFTVILASITISAAFKQSQKSRNRPEPSFVSIETNFTFTEGDLARLRCSVSNLGTKKVIWRRMSDPNPLTIGQRTFVEDRRITVEHSPLHPDWNLIIKQVRRDDAGVYECQVSSRSRFLRWNVSLYVIARTTPRRIKPAIKIKGAKYVEKGMNVRLTCNATGAVHPPDEIDWFKNGDKLETNYARKVYIQKRVSLTTRTILSILEIKNAKMTDAGLYICRTSDLQIKSRRVNVLNAETVNVKRGTEHESENASGFKDGHALKAVNGKASSSKLSIHAELVSFLTFVTVVSWEHWPTLYPV